MFLAELKRLQGDRSQKGYARDLGISQSTLSRLYVGSIDWAQLRMSTVKRMCEKHPTLLAQVLAFFCGSDMRADGNTGA